MTHEGFDIRVEDMPLAGGGSVTCLAIYRGERRMAWVIGSTEFAKRVIEAHRETWKDKPSVGAPAPRRGVCACGDGCR